MSQPTGTHSHRFDWSDEAVTDPICTRCDRTYSEIKTAGELPSQKATVTGTLPAVVTNPFALIDLGETYEQKLARQEHRRNRYHANKNR